LRGIIKQSFASVFEALNVAAETQYQRFRLKNVTQERFADYVVRVVGTFPLFGTTKQASVESAYVRIGLSSRLERERYRKESEIEDALKLQRGGQSFDPERHATGKTLQQVLAEVTTAVALVGNPGSGKTTTLRHLAVSLAKGERIRGKRYIPLFLSVRDLTVQAQSIETAAVQFLEWLDVVEAPAVLRALLEAGDLAILLDGIDEADRPIRLKLLREISKIREQYSSALVCISGRPYTLSTALPGFQKWETLPLTATERLDLIKTWYQAVDPAKGEKLLAECADDPGLLDLGTNPLLLSIVCALYYNDLKIPDEPDELYARTIEGLLGAWDAFRNIARETPIRDFSVRRRAVLMSWLAATMFERGKLAFSARDVDDTRVLVRFADSTHTPVLPADELLTSLYNDFGILIERAPGLFSFSHLTFQEYLTAQYIVDNRREIQLLRRRRDQTWAEVIRLVAKMLPNANIYMAALTETTEVSSKADLTFLLATWSMRPICERFEIIKSMKVIADRTVDALVTLHASYRVKNGQLIVSSRDDYELAVSKKQASVIRNLPLIAELFRVTSVSLRDLQVEGFELFKTLRDERFSIVDIKGSA
jgi:predicted NACHT family NTPase